MAWTKTGTVAVTTGSAIVTGAGTSWIAMTTAGEGFLGPDGKVYEILSVDLNTQITLAGVYLGATQAGQSYSILPTQAYILSLANQVSALISSYAAVKDNAGAGKFQAGTQSVPGMRFVSDDNTGLRSTGPDAMALVAGGVDQAVVNSNGFTARILRMWNTAGTFVGSFTSALTAARTWTFPDKDGTVAMVSDFASPGPIGYTAPSTINATDLTAKGSVNFGSGQAATASASVYLGGNNTTQLALVSYGAAYAGVSAQGIGANGSLVDAITGNLALNAMAGKNVRLGVGYATVATVLPTGLSVDGHLMVGVTVSNSNFEVRGSAALTASAATVGGYQVLSFSSGAYDKCRIRGISVTAADAGALAFDTAPDGDLVQERVRIDQNGKLLVGATIPMGSEKMLVKSSGASKGIMSANADTATTSSLLFWGWAAGTDRFIVFGNGNTVNTNNSYGALSDLKLKENIADVSPKLTKLLRVRVVNYNLKADPDHKQIGVIAQELEQISPGLIEETPDYIDVEVEPARTDVNTVQRQKVEQREDVRYETTLVDGQWRKLPVCVTVDVPLFEYHPLFDETGAALMEVAEPQQPEVLDADGQVTTPFKPAVYRQSVHRAPVMEDVQEMVEVPAKVERQATGEVTKSVKYSVFVPMLIKAMQEQQTMIDALTQRLGALETA